MSAKIVIMLGSVRPGRMAERVGITIKNIVAAQGLEPVMLDPLELPFELLKVPLQWMKEPEKDAPEWMLEVNEKIKSADGFIVVSPEYNSGVAPALANMLDHFAPSAYRHRPCGIVTYSMGTHRGVRAQVMLRPMLSEVGMGSVPAYVGIPNVNQSFEENGECTSERISNNLTKLVKEVEWYATAIRNQKASVPPPE